MIKPWMQILIFVVLSNIAHIALMMIGLEIDEEIFVYLALTFSFWFSVFLLTVPVDSASTGHKLLTLTCVAGALFCGVLTISTTWAGEYILAWYVFSWMREHFYATMQLLTAMEILSIFANSATRLGRVGGAIDGIINHVYSAVFLRAYAVFSGKRF